MFLFQLSPGGWTMWSSNFHYANRDNLLMFVSILFRLTEVVVWRKFRHLWKISTPKSFLAIFPRFLANFLTIYQGWKIYRCSQLTLVLNNFFYFRGIFLLFKAMDVFYFLWVDTSWSAVWHYKPLDRSWSRSVRANWHSGDVHLQKTPLIPFQHRKKKLPPVPLQHIKKKNPWPLDPSHSTMKK